MISYEIKLQPKMVPFWRISFFLFSFPAAFLFNEQKKAKKKKEIPLELGACEFLMDVYLAR